MTGAIEGILTRSFRSAFLVAAALAVAALLPGGGPPAAHPTRRRAPSRARAPLSPWCSACWWRRAACWCSNSGAGAADYGTYASPDPCTASNTPYDGDGIDGVVQRIALGGLNGAACELGVSREALVLSLDEGSGFADVAWDKATVEKAIKAGTLRAIDDGDDRDTLPAWSAWLLRKVVEHAPVGWMLDRLPF